jgi:hypothetical protein
MEEQKKSSKLIWVAIDDSITILQWALNNLLASQDRVILIMLSAIQFPPLATGSPIFMVPVDVLMMLENDIKKSKEKILAKATEICKAKNVSKVYIGMKGAGVNQIIGLFQN